MRILILGAPGSGKTTLARALSRNHQVPHEELDILNFARDHGRIEVAPYKMRVARAQALADTGHWVCEGNYLGWTEPLMGRAHLIVRLQASLPLQLRRVVWRHAVLDARGINPYPGWLRLARFSYYIAMAHLNRLEPYTAQDVRAGPVSTEQALGPYQRKVLALPACMPTERQVREIMMRLRSLGVQMHEC